MSNEKKPLTELLVEFARASGQMCRRKENGVVCVMNDARQLTLFDRPIIDSRMSKRLVYGIIYDPTNKFGMVKYVTDDIIEYLRKKLTEYLEQHELKARIMDPKNLETAERMAKKRSELQAMLDLLTNYVSMASVTVTVPTTFATYGHQHKQATIQSDTFNALVSALVEKEIASIDEFVKSL